MRSHRNRKPWWYVRPSLQAMFILTVCFTFGLPYYDSPQPRVVETQTPPTPPSPRDKAMQRLAEADKKAKAAMNARLETLANLFSRGKSGAKEFSEDALSWSGKWALLKGKVGIGEDKAHEKFLAESFAKHIFAGDDIKTGVDAAIKGFLIDLEGIESEMLVQLRADLADGPQPSMPEFLRSDEAFHKEYERFRDDATRTLDRDLKVTAGREVGMFVASDVAAQVAIRVARFVAAELGVEAGILGAGAASSVATLGIGLIAAVILDYVLDAVFKMAGYDPAGEIASKVKATIGNVENVLIEGRNGLRHELESLHKAKSALRQEIVNKLVEEGGK